MVNLLSKFKQLVELSLHGNQLKSIPPLSSLQKLVVLDLSNNPIKVIVCKGRLMIFYLIDCFRFLSCSI